MTDFLVTKMRRRDAVSAEEAAVLHGIRGTHRRHAAGADLILAGDRPNESTLLLSGFCGRLGLLRDGGRQFTEINVPGDFVDLHSLLLKTMDHGVVALTDCEVVAVPHADLRRLTEAHPHLARLLWLETVIDGAIHRQWLVMMGRQDALGRMAHLVCEMAVRLEAAGVADRLAFELPLTQAVLADVLGLSPVHVNRTLMALRSMGILEWKSGQVTILDWDGLADVAEFDPAYLRLRRDPV
ncbi:MAG TPA: Crp/Fnr family transcriptional regulator [Caulobacter sp.]|nr:Crp/Fnr family transcriptional regulator [Caulobacter sp.]